MDELTTIAWQNAIHAILRNVLGVLQSLERRVAALENESQEDDHV